MSLITVLIILTAIYNKNTCNINNIPIWKFTLILFYILEKFQRLFRSISGQSISNFKAYLRHKLSSNIQPKPLQFMYAISDNIYICKIVNGNLQSNPVAKHTRDMGLKKTLSLRSQRNKLIILKNFNPINCHLCLSDKQTCDVLGQMYIRLRVESNLKLN